MQLIRIQQMEQWSGAINWEVVLEVPLDVDVEKERNKQPFLIAEDAQAFVDHLISLGAKKTNDIPTFIF